MLFYDFPPVHGSFVNIEMQKLEGKDIFKINFYPFLAVFSNLFAF